MAGKMIASTWKRVPNEHKVLSFTVGLVVFCMAVAYFGGIMSHAPTITRKVQVVHVPGTGAALAAAWGAPDQSVRGEQINPGLKGLTCNVYQSRKAILCF